MSKIIITIKRIYRLTLAVLAVLGTVAIMGFVSPRVEYLEKQVHIPVEKPQPTLKELVNTVPDKYGISPLIVGAMLERESGARMDAIRFEPHHLNRVQSLCKGRGSDYCRQLASSHGALQIMGWWAPTLGITWAELYDPETNIEAGCTILKKCLDKQHSGKKVQRIRGALACYNGSEAYANAVLDRLGEMMIERML